MMRRSTSPPPASLHDLLDQLETPEEYTRKAMALMGGKVPPDLRGMIQRYEASYHGLYMMATYDSVRRQVDGVLLQPQRMGDRVFGIKGGADRSGGEDHMEQARRLRGRGRV